MYYKQAIAKGPTQINLYMQLIDLYRYNMQDTAKALAVVNQGLVKLPNNANLLQLKAELSK